MGNMGGRDFDGVILAWEDGKQVEARKAPPCPNVQPLLPRLKHHLLHDKSIAGSMANSSGM